MNFSLLLSDGNTGFIETCKRDALPLVQFYLRPPPAALMGGHRHSYQPAAPLVGNISR
jgi:hypothetical protein